MANPLRILVVDDSALVRRLLRELLESDPELRVVGEAADGRQALKSVAELRPDLVTLDVRMPVMDGVETTKQIMAYHPTPILVLTASLAGGDVDISLRMLGAGALDVIEKPQLGSVEAVERWRRELLRKVRLLSRVKVVTHLRGRRQNAEGRGEQRASSAFLPDSPRRQAPVLGGPLGQRTTAASYGSAYAPFPLVVIGASTGGPRVVRQLLGALPNGFSAAVLVVQHIAQGFSEGLVEWLAAASTLPVQLAAEGSALAPGVVLVAPDRFDLLVRPDYSVHLSGHPLLLQRPAIDIAMQSVAAVFGEASVGVLLTGMGRDGAVGMQAIRRVGGLTIAQDEASCLEAGIYGMPRAAVELGAAELVLPPERVVGVLLERLIAGKGGRP